MRLGDIKTYNRHIQSAYCSKNQYPYIILPIYNLFMIYSSPYTILMPSQHFTNLDKMILTNMSTRAHTPSGEREIRTFSQKHSKLFAEIVPQAEN